MVSLYATKLYIWSHIYSYYGNYPGVLLTVVSCSLSSTEFATTVLPIRQRRDRINTLWSSMCGRMCWWIQTCGVYNADAPVNLSSKHVVNGGYSRTSLGTTRFISSFTPQLNPTGHDHIDADCHTFFDGAFWKYVPRIPLEATHSKKNLLS